MSSVAISVRGKVREEGPSRLDELLEHNPYMYDIYPTPASREVLTVFKVYEGTGEWFDLSVKPIDRASFAFVAHPRRPHGYFVNAASCIGCGACLPVCPQQCIALANGVAAIDQATASTAAAAPTSARQTPSSDVRHWRASSPWPHGPFPCGLLSTFVMFYHCGKTRGMTWRFY